MPRPALWLTLRRPVATKKSAARPRARRASTARSGSRRRVGVWLFGACGGLATTVVVGARAIARNLAPPHGLLTETPMGQELPLANIDDLVFGGHEVRDVDFSASARELHERDGTIAAPLLHALKADLKRLDRNLCRGVLPNAGATIRRMVGTTASRSNQASLRAQLDRIRKDIREFQRRNKLDQVVCVNLTSTEPRLRLTAAHRSLAKFEHALERNDERLVRPSALYAYAAATLGLPFIHFTPSNAALIPAIRECFEQNKAPYMGADGKTGETLVKSALAPMFKYRNLRVLTWQGYNILGDRDGMVLSDADNKRSKVESKDALLPGILGYPLHSHVGIDYVPSLQDHKTAWDFIHFEGFLGHRMSMQFVWQGCDAILAAPLVVDMVRFADYSAHIGESGPMHHLACYFKQPLDSNEHDLHRQWQTLVTYVADHRQA